MTRPLVMGVVNVTPDSFSDGGRFLDPEAAVSHARALIAEGADILDVGGESTRPGATPVSQAEEIDRVVPLIAAIRAESAIPISVDTMKPAVARAAVAAGASIWNDVTALGSEDSADLAAELGCDVILMHMQGEPGTMQANPWYGEVTHEVLSFLAGRANRALSAGVAPERIWVDPGIGFGKSLEHNLELLRDIEVLSGLGYPVVLGVSRKSFIRKIDPTAASVSDRLGGSLAGALWGASHGVRALRVHDVRETVQALEVWAAIDRASP